MKQIINQQVSQEEEQIKESAFLLFKEKGYENVCLNDIAKKSGVRDWIIEIYFGTIENLYNVVNEGPESTLLYNEVV
jgi:hypothetical protein